MALDLSNAVYPPTIPERRPEKTVAVDCEEADDIVRCCSDFVCKELHTKRWLGICLWDVISIKIRRNMEYDDPLVRIHGAIRVQTNEHFSDYLFKRTKVEAQRFEHPGEVLTLSLVGPHKPWVLEGFSGQPGIALFALLKYNDEDIFDISDHPLEYLKGCPEPYKGYSGDFEDCSHLFSENEHPVKPVGYWGDFEDCSHLFSENEHPVKPVGYGWVYDTCISGTYVYTSTFDNKILDKVVSVEVERAHIFRGLVARLIITSSIDLYLYGKITARSCLFKNGVVLFHKTRKEAMLVKSNQSIPLSRSMAALDGRSSLVIKVQAHDAKDSNFYVNETIQFNPLPKGCFSEKTTSNSVFSVKVEWTFEFYEGPDFRFP